MAVKIVGATSTGISVAAAQQLDLTIVPLRVNFGVETLRDSVDISPEAFLDRLATSKQFPTTSQPPAGDFLEVFQRLRAAGHDCDLIELEVREKVGRVRGDQDLRAPRGHPEEAGQQREDAWMQSQLGLVDAEKRGQLGR